MRPDMRVLEIAGAPRDWNDPQFFERMGTGEGRVCPEFSPSLDERGKIAPW